MYYNYFGCLVTNLLNFQAFLNYPCTRGEVYGNYTLALTAENTFWSTSTGWTAEEQEAMVTPLQAVQIAGVPNLLWTCKHYLGPGCPRCETMQALQGPLGEAPADGEQRVLYISGCQLKFPLDQSICNYINEFPVT
jgi:hypothetical protein